ncbi:cation:proton antiporter subunit C [Woodsholea maritima]|uniref:cation:proton antiporter subunit C n=1 Tax=Woodsholea maritima TaxID=240237 RepID=UPI00035C6471|nr:cation:proton antiporter subunit C [Woodsholea maritima]
MVELISERFNYIIVIALMMIGLYGVVSSANLVKRLVGLSIFQTSVFLLYITMGKVFGGVPPILPYPAEHGDGHGSDAGHGTAAAHAGEGAHHSVEAAHDGDHIQSDAQTHGATPGATQSDAHAGAQGADVAHGASQAASHGDLRERVGEAVHSLAEQAAHHDAGPAAYDGVHHTAEIIYSNPLPHVLILTAIVVGVATLAVGLALVVRIRESYGTIEDSAIARADYSDEIERGTA